MTGIFTDQYVSSTLRSLADESFNVIVIDDGCAAGTDELLAQELAIINMIYCHVMRSHALLTLLGDPSRDRAVAIARQARCRYF